ncbi:hypothetical protein GW891_02675 [bacterium]|nr:hypothetical protein [bacterium]
MLLGLEIRLNQIKYAIITVHKLISIKCKSQTKSNQSIINIGNIIIDNKFLIAFFKNKVIQTKKNTSIEIR